MMFPVFSSHPRFYTKVCLCVYWCVITRVKRITSAVSASYCSTSANPLVDDGERTKLQSRLSI